MKRTRVALVVVATILFFGCGELLELMFSDDVPPVVQYTSHENGDMYLTTDVVTMLSAYESVISIEAIISDLVPDGGSGALLDAHIEVEGYPELSGCICRTESGEITSLEIAGNVSELERADSSDAVVEINAGSLSGSITIRITAIDWNGNEGFAEIRLDPPIVVTEFRMEQDLNPELAIIGDQYASYYSDGVQLSDNRDFRATTDIIVYLPLIDDRTALIPSFEAPLSTVTVDGVVQTSGVSVVDFTDPVDYTVIANDGSTRTYLVSVLVS